MKTPPEQRLNNFKKLDDALLKAQARKDEVKIKVIIAKIVALFDKYSKEKD